VSQSGLVRSEADPEEQAAESALRPATLAEFAGQSRVSDQLGLVLEAARHRGGVADHVLLSGPPGLGKTTLAMIIAAEMSAPLRISSGPAITHAGDLAAILSGLVEGEVFFLDEIHRMSRPAEEMLYLAMEDFRVDVVVGKGPGATAIPLEIPRFTLVGATTRAGLLPGPLRDRFGFTAQLDFYDVAALERRVPTTPRSAPVGRSTAGWPRPRWSCTRWTSWAWTGSTAACWRRSAPGSAAVPSGCPHWPSRWGRSGRRSRRWRSRSWSVRAS
jgi:Holliday junction DNA helicase RuvB